MKNYSEKLIIISDCRSDKSTSELQSIILRTIGMKITDIIYIDHPDILSDEIEDNMLSSLNKDWYNKNDVNIDIREAKNGLFVIGQISEYINDVYDENNDVIICSYNTNIPLINKINKMCSCHNKKISIIDLYEYILIETDTEIVLKDILNKYLINTKYYDDDNKIIISYYISALFKAVNLG